MQNIKIYFLSASSGKSENGDFYRVTLNISEQTNGGERNYSADFFVEIELFAKTKSFEKFQEVDAIFIPTSSGRARLVSIEGL